MVIQYIFILRTALNTGNAVMAYLEQENGDWWEMSWSFSAIHWGSCSPTSAPAICHHT